MYRFFYGILFVLIFYECQAVNNHLLDKQNEILTFWFGELKVFDQWDREKAQLWFFGPPQFDREIQKRFEDDVLLAASGAYAHWKKTARGYLALIILLDQFPRNMYRKTSQAYQFDAIAVSLALEGIEKGKDVELFPVERQFFYLPLQHSEDMAMQEISLKLFQRLAKMAPKVQDNYFEQVLFFAMRHYKTIEEFGRFPHRNVIFNRESSEREEEFLKLKKS